MSTEVLVSHPVSADLQEKVLIGGDLSKLSPAERLSYYSAVCESVGLNPLTQPFEYINLNGKLRLYAKKDCTDQLRKIHGVSIVPGSTRIMQVEDVRVVVVAAQDKTGRTDEGTGAVAIGGLKGDALANAIMKCETKAKRRATLSICGLGMLDETELETIPQPPVSIPQVRPPIGDRDMSPPSKPPALEPRQEDGAGSGTGASQSNSPLSQQGSDAPAPLQDDQAQPTYTPPTPMREPYRIKSGKNKGKLITELSRDWLEWAYANAGMPMKKIAEEELTRRALAAKPATPAAFVLAAYGQLTACTTNDELDTCVDRLWSESQAYKLTDAQQDEIKLAYDNQRAKLAGF